MISFDFNIDITSCGKEWFWISIQTKLVIDRSQVQNVNYVLRLKLYNKLILKLKEARSNWNLFGRRRGMDAQMCLTRENTKR